MMMMPILVLRWRMMFQCKLTRDCDGCPRFDKCFDEKQDEIELLLNKLAFKHMKETNWMMTATIRIILD